MLIQKHENSTAHKVSCKVHTLRLSKQWKEGGGGYVSQSHTLGRNKEHPWMHQEDAPLRWTATRALQATVNRQWWRGNIMEDWVFLINYTFKNLRLSEAWSAISFAICWHQPCDCCVHWNLSDISGSESCCTVVYKFWYVFSFYVLCRHWLHFSCLEEEPVITECNKV